MMQKIPSADGDDRTADAGAKVGAAAGASIQWPSLLVALTIMIAGSVYPLLFTAADGMADHRLALALFWAMSAGFVRGVGFVPRMRAWRLLFSGWSCVAALVLAGWLRFGV